MMFRDTFAVPATGAGVEREFSKSGRVVTPIRARLNHTTVTESMLVKSMLVRQGEMLTYQEDDADELGTHDDEEEKTAEVNFVCDLWRTLINLDENM